MSASWFFCVNAFDFDFWVQVDSFNKQSRATRWVRGTRLIVGLLPLTIIFITDSSKSLEARPATRAQIPCLWERDVEKRRVIIGILPCVVITSLQTGASMATIA